MSKKPLVILLLFLCIVTLITYSVWMGKPYMESRRNESTRQAILQDGFKKHDELARAFSERLSRKVKAIDKAGYTGEERKRRILAEGEAAKQEMQRVRNSNFTLPYRME